MSSENSSAMLQFEDKQRRCCIPVVDSKWDTRFTHRFWPLGSLDRRIPAERKINTSDWQQHYHCIIHGRELSSFALAVMQALVAREHLLLSQCNVRRLASRRYSLRHIFLHPCMSSNTLSSTSNCINIPSHLDRQSL